MNPRVHNQSPECNHRSHKRNKRVCDDDDDDSGRHRSPRSHKLNCCRDDEDGAPHTGRVDDSRSRKYSRAHRDRDSDRSHKLTLRPHRDRDASSSSSSSLPNLCLISSCHSDVFHAYNLHILDLDSRRFDDDDDDRFILTPPALRLESRDFAGDGFCVFNSVIYIFDSERRGSSVFVINLTTLDYKHSSITTRKSRLTVKSDLEKVGDLLKPKKSPVAALTPDGKKILVFSSRLNQDCYSDDDDSHGHDDFKEDPVEFELYDPSKQTSERIPGIAHTSRKPFEAVGFTFIGESVFALQTQVGLFVIDLHLLHQGWKTPDVNFFTRIPRSPCCLDRLFVIDGGSTCVTSCYVYDIDDQQGGGGAGGGVTSENTTFSVLRLSSFDGHRFHRHYQPRKITQLLHPNNNNMFAVVKSANHKETEHPHLIVDIIECCNKEPMIRRSFKFRLDGLPCDVNFPRHLFPIC